MCVCTMVICYVCLALSTVQTTEEILMVSSTEQLSDTTSNNTGLSIGGSKFKYTLDKEYKKGLIVFLMNSLLS